MKITPSVNFSWGKKFSSFTKELTLRPVNFIPISRRLFSDQTMGHPSLLNNDLKIFVLLNIRRGDRGLINPRSCVQCNTFFVLNLVHFPFFILIFYRDTAAIFNEGVCGVCVSVCGWEWGWGGFMIIRVDS